VDAELPCFASLVTDGHDPDRVTLTPAADAAAATMPDDSLEQGASQYAGRVRKGAQEFVASLECRELFHSGE